MSTVKRVPNVQGRRILIELYSDLLYRIFTG